MATSLPQELKREIVNYLIGDIDSLKACSLALPGYSPFCQSRLFSKITLKGNIHCCKLACVLAGSPHLATHIKCVKIHIFLSREGWQDEDTTDSLLYILPLLQNLSSFYLHCHNDGLWRRLHPTLVDCFADVMRLPSLTLVNIGGFVPLQILNHGLHLKHISILDCDIALPPPTFSQRPAEGPIYLETLYISPLVHIVDWFLSSKNSISLSRLKKLAFGVEYEGGSEQVSRILDACKHTLEDFTLEPYFEIYYPPSPSPDFLDLTHLTSLRALRMRLELTMNCSDNVFLNPLPWYIRHIERLPSSNFVEVITIHIAVSSIMDVLSFDWSSWQTVSTVLLKSLSHLRRLELGIYCSQEAHYAPCITNIRRYTTDLRDAGVFRLEKLSFAYGDTCPYPSCWQRFKISEHDLEG